VSENGGSFINLYKIIKRRLYLLTEWLPLFKIIYEQLFIYTYIKKEDADLKKNNEAPRCDCNVIHHDIIEKVRGEMPALEYLYDLSELFKSLGDQTRLKILFALSMNEMCVCDIAALLDMSQSAISHQLRVLRNVRLVRYHKVGKVVYYTLDDEHVNEIFRQGLDHVEHQ
jgi:ArsR family transcriptional regulator